MRKWSGFLIALAGACTGTPLLAQTPPNGTDQSTIVVQGRRDRNTEIRELVDTLPPAWVGGHINRFEHSACPAVLGLPPAMRTLVVERMRAVARAGGVPVGNAGCQANVVVMVTSDKRQLIELLARRFPNYLGELTNHQIAQLARSPEPAALWHLNGMVDAAGRELSAPGEPYPVQRTTHAASRLTDQAHMEFTGSVLVIESRALTGLSTTQVADYAAMRTLTGADPARLPDRSLSTILTLLDAPMGSQVPVTLTNWDLAFLESIYASDANRYAPGQRREIRAGIDRRLEPPAEPAPHH
jgi:hypothetical protein